MVFLGNSQEEGRTALARPCNSSILCGFYLQQGGPMWSGQREKERLRDELDSLM